MAGAQIKNFATAHPVAAATIGIGAAVVASPGLLIAPALAVAGFTSSGVAAGSMAAAVHSSIGSVAAGSAFATLQSAGAGGAGLAIVKGVSMGFGGITAITGGLMGYFSGKGDPEEAAGEETQNNEEQEDQMKTHDVCVWAG